MAGGSRSPGGRTSTATATRSAITFRPARSRIARRGDKRFKQRIEYIANELAACQEAAGSGLVCAFPQGPALIAAHLRGDTITGVPWYTLHKVYAGLRDAALLADSEPRARSCCGWPTGASSPPGRCPIRQFEAMLATEHGGMNEIYADLYLMTGNADYRTLAQRFSHKAILEPLAAGARSAGRPACQYPGAEDRRLSARLRGHRRRQVSRRRSILLEHGCPDALVRDRRAWRQRALLSDGGFRRTRLLRQGDPKRAASTTCSS